MEYIIGYDFKFENTAITLGKFDGIHLGHQMLVNKIVHSKKKEGLTSVMFTFITNPQSLLQDKRTRKIYTEKEKSMILESMGLDVLISYPFNKEVASITARDFVKDILVGQIGAKMIVVGQDFHFGYNREGNVELLEELSSEFGYELVVIEDLKFRDRRISSTYIKEALADGKMELANHLLGTPYTIFGKVIHGRKIGRTLGFPTINTIPNKSKILPPNGVYISLTSVNGKDLPGITNLGQNPTVGKSKVKRAETFLFDFDEDLYGALIKVHLISKIRDEKKFDSVELLKEQVNKDIIIGREYFNM